MQQAPNPLRFNIYGRSVEVSASLAGLGRTLGSMFNTQPPAAVNAGQALRGYIFPFERHQLNRNLTASATRLPWGNPLQELYGQDERFWLIDEGFGICELNMLKQQWRAWVLPNTPMRVLLDNGFYWPLSQLLARPGFCALPAVSITRNGWGGLLLHEYPIDSEIKALTRAGFRVVGQRWTTLSINAAAATLGGLPEPVATETGTRLNLADPFYGCRAASAGADAVIIIRNGRRPRAAGRQIVPSSAAEALGSVWPACQIPRRRALGDMPGQLAERCKVFEAHLSPNSAELIRMLSRIRYPRISVSLSVPAKLQRVA